MDTNEHSGRSTRTVKNMRLSAFVRAGGGTQVDSLSLSGLFLFFDATRAEPVYALGWRVVIFCVCCNSRIICKSKSWSNEHACANGEGLFFFA